MRMLIFCSIQQNTSQLRPFLKQLLLRLLPLSLRRAFRHRRASVAQDLLVVHRRSHQQPELARKSCVNGDIYTFSVSRILIVHAEFEFSPEPTNNSEFATWSSAKHHHPPKSASNTETGSPKPNYNVSLSDIFTNTNQQPPLVMSSMSPPNPSNPSNQPHAPMSGTFSAPAVTPFAPPAVASRQR